MVRPWRHFCYDIWLTLGDECHGGEVLSTNEDAYHVQGEVMINIVGSVEPMFNFWWRNDVRICRVFLGLYHVGGRMIPALELSVDGAVDGFYTTFKIKYHKWKHIIYSNIIWKACALKKKIREGIPAGTKKLFFWGCECVAPPLGFMERWSQCFFWSSDWSF